MPQTTFSTDINHKLAPEARTWLAKQSESSGKSVDAILCDLIEEHENRQNRFPLSMEQLGRYYRDGYLLVSGLVPEDVSARAERAMWHCIGCDPQNPPLSWDNAPGDLRLYNNADLKNCFTPNVISAAAQLTGDHASTFSKSDTHPKSRYTATYLEAEAAKKDLNRFYRWDCAYTINILPGSGDQGNQPHIDHSMEEHHHQTFPPVFRLGVLIFLNNSGPSSGGTRVWPRSHRILLELARKSPKRYEWRKNIMTEISTLDLGEPMNLTLSRGDVLFLHHLIAHAGSYNDSNRPRFALNMKW